MHGQLDTLLEVLDHRERKIIDARFGLDGQKPKTLEEVGQEFGVTRERIRQLQNIALKKLRRALQKKEDPGPLLLKWEEVVAFLQGSELRGLTEASAACLELGRGRRARQLAASPVQLEWEAQRDDSPTAGVHRRRPPGRAVSSRLPAWPRRPGVPGGAARAAGGGRRTVRCAASALREGMADGGRPLTALAAALPLPLPAPRP